MVLIIKHIDIEGPEALGDFFNRHGLKTRIVELQEEETLPSQLNDIEAVVSLGGPMNVYEEDQYPFLRPENEFIKKILAQGIPFLGICLGAQLLAKAASAKVGRAPHSEIGFFRVQLTPDGQKDPLFKGMSKELDVFQWHGDMFEIPQAPVKGQWLAKSDICPYQAMKVGSCAYGLQFHIEITDKSIREWSAAYFQKDNPEHQKKIKEMLDYYQKNKKTFHGLADKIFENFLGIITQRRSSVV